MLCRATDRLTHLCVALNLSLTQFAERLGLTIRRAKRILKNHRKPSIGLLARIRRAFPQISPDWLILGEGDVFLQSTTHVNHVGCNYGTLTQIICPGRCAPDCTLLP